MRSAGLCELAPACCDARQGKAGVVICDWKLLQVLECAILPQRHGRPPYLVCAFEICASQPAVPILGSPQRPCVPPGVLSGGSEGYVVMMRERLQDTATWPHLAAPGSHAPVTAARSREPSPGPASAAGKALAPAAASPALPAPARPAPAATAAATDSCAGGGGGRGRAAAAGRGLASQAPEPEPAGAAGGASAPAEGPSLAPGVSPAVERAAERGVAAAERRPRRRGREARKRRRGADRARDAGSPARSGGPGSVRAECDATGPADAPLGHASAAVIPMAQTSVGGCNGGACGREAARGARRELLGRGDRNCAPAVLPERRAGPSGLAARAVRAGCAGGDAGCGGGGAGGARRPGRASPPGASELGLRVLRARAMRAVQAQLA